MQLGMKMKLKPDAIHTVDEPLQQADEIGDCSLTRSKTKGEDASHLNRACFWVNHLYSYFFGFLKFCNAFLGLIKYRLQHEN